MVSAFMSLTEAVVMRGCGLVRLYLVTVIAPQPTASPWLVMLGYGWFFLKNRITFHPNSILEIIVLNSTNNDFINPKGSFFYKMVPHFRLLEPLRRKWGSTVVSETTEPVAGS